MLRYCASPDNWFCSNLLIKFSAKFRSISIKKLGKSKLIEALVSEMQLPRILRFLTYSHYCNLSRPNSLWT